MTMICHSKNEKYITKENVLRVVNHFGVRHQAKKLNEECSELLEAVVDYENGKYYMEEEKALQSYREHVVEELADCVFVLEQIASFYNVVPTELYDQLGFKVNRTIKIVEDEESKNGN